MAQSKAGDHGAFMELIRRTSPVALRAIRNIARNPADADHFSRMCCSRLERKEQKASHILIIYADRYYGFPIESV